ncbi:MAG: helix-turn-helix domain-containing protein [Deltaproteobacteria bacterium]|nr:helix-turn-helix domain-containing protein [Deltaproteobacteria bacterium]
MRAARLALMRVAIVRPFERFLRRIGAPVERIAERVHLPIELLRDPEALLPVWLGTAFVAEAARVSGVEHLGATVAATTHVAELGTYGRMLARAASLQDVLATARRFHASHHSGEAYWFDAAHAPPLLCQRFTVRLDDPNGQMSQYAILLVAGLLASLARGAWRPTIHLRKEVPRSVADTPWNERVDLRFGGDRCAVALEPRVLPMTASPAGSPVHATRELVDWYGTRPAAALVPSLRQWLGRVLRTDAVRIEVLAETIGTTPRTLQRRLAEAGTTYARVLGETRFQVAADLLARDIEIREVARAVGYRDGAHLTRAFRRWSGATPSAYRGRVRAAFAGTAPPPVRRAVAQWQPVV